MPERPRSQPGGALGTEHGTVNVKRVEIHKSA